MRRRVGVGRRGCGFVLRAGHRIDVERFGLLLRRLVGLRAVRFRRRGFGDGDAGEKCQCEHADRHAGSSVSNEDAADGGG